MASSRHCRLVVVGQEETYNSRHGLAQRLRLSLLPIQNRKRSDFQHLPHLLLRESKFQPPFLVLLAQSLGFKVKRYFSQELEANRDVWQKSNASISLRYHGHYNGKCRCTPDQITRYRSKISGPLLDRIDIQIKVPAVPQEELLDKVDGEASAELQARVEIARQRQLARQNKANALLSVTEIETLCTPDAQGAALLQQAISRLNLSARAYHRVLKVARSIADLDDSRDIANMHIAEAVQYRRLNL